MSNILKPWAVTGLLVPGCLFFLLFSSAAIHAGDKKKEADKEVLLGKTDGLTAKDEMDTKLKTSYRKVYKVKLTEGMAYRIDLTSKDFDTFLRLENAAGKEVAFNDDVAPNDLNSRILYAAPKTGEYRIIVTTFVAKTTGLFVLEMTLATEAEAKEARFQARVDGFWDSPRAEQKKVLLEVTKDFQDKGDKLALKDAQLVVSLVFMGDDSEPAYLREMGQSFAKIFEGASDKRLAGFSNAIRQSMKSLDKIGKEFEITGKTLAGKEFDLKNMKGKVVLVDFWGTWCPPCVAEIPNIVSVYEKYHGKGFEVIGVTQPAKNQDDAGVSDFLQKQKMPWTCITIEDSLKLIKMHQVNSYPNPILIGPDGRIVSARARGPQLERMLARLLVEKK
jgi:thiol-disulfide isomerase/thioredoxin